MNDTLRKLPIWAYTLALMVVAAASSVFGATMTTSYLNEMGIVAIHPVYTIVMVGILYGFIARLLIRVIYALGDRLFFMAMHNVPDYNLRRLPVAYNEFVRCILFWLVVAKAVGCVFVSLLQYVYPVGYYMWRFLATLAAVACFAVGYYLMDKRNVPTWQSFKCYLCLAIPTAVVYLLVFFL